jgi:TniQ
MMSEKNNVVSVSEVIPGVSTYEIVDSVPPDISPRSWAYHLTPIGIGHSYAESLTSYFTRLAREHRVTPRTLFNGRGVYIDEENTKYIGGLVETNASKATAQINGPGQTAEKWVAMVEGLTQRKNLKFLTFLTWRPVFNKSMCRAERAWCPSCLEDGRLAEPNPFVYEQLCWTHKNVRVCSTHGIHLETECPHCGANSWFLSGSAHPGFCQRCNRWLGHYSDRTGSAIEEVKPNNADYEIFAAKQIGELIRLAPGLTCVPDQKVAKGSIIRCAERFFDGNLCAFVNYLGLSKTTTYPLYNGKPRIIHLELLLRIGFQTSIPLFDLLTREDSLDGFNPLPSSSLPSNRLSPRRKKENVLKTLLAALEEIPPPSLKEMTERLGYSSSSILRSYFPEVCDQITANYRQSARGKEKMVFGKRLQEDDVIQAALESALKEDPPPSLPHISRQLGYKTCEAIRKRFTDLCRALTGKRLNLYNLRRKQVVPELEQALSSDPPTSLAAIAKKLGYRTNRVLRTNYPEMCRRINERYAKYNQTQFMGRVRREVDSVLMETSPPPLKVALQRIGISDGFLKKHFPEEHRALSARYLNYRKDQAERHKDSDRSKIRDIVRDFIKRGIFPSMNAVLDVYTASYLKRPEVWATVLQAREEFGFRISEL